MLEEQIVSSILAERAAYDQIAGILDPSNFSEHGRLVVQLAADHYARDSGATSCPEVVVETALTRLLPSPKHRSACLDYVRSLPPPVAAFSVVAEYRLLLQHNVGLELAACLASGRHADASALVEQYSRLGEGAAGVQRDGPRLTVEELEDLTGTSHALPLYPKRLDVAAKHRATAGHHLIVFARPECGKTGFLVNMGSGQLKAGLRVLHATNEEPRRDLQLRYLARLAGCTIDALWGAGGIQKATAAAGEAYERLCVAELETSTIHEIEGWIRRWKPDVVFVDQLRNLSMGGKGADNRVLELDSVARRLRNVAKAHGVLVVSVTQAGDSAEGKQVLTMGDVDWSNTGIQAAADMMIGIGVTPELRAQGKRWVQLCKNKIGGTHDGFPVWVDMARGTWSSKAPSRVYS